jgi:hypothetical protein
LHEFQRRHLDVRGAVAPGTFQLQHNVTGAIALEPFVGDRRTRDVTVVVPDNSGDPDIREFLYCAW